jgi:hypothetical protein
VSLRDVDRLGDEVVCELVEARRAGAKLRELIWDVALVISAGAVA